MTTRLLSLLFGLLMLLASGAQASLFSPPASGQFIPASQAFAFDFSQRQQQLTLSWQIKPGYYLYRQQLKLSVKGATLAPYTLPAGEPHNDEFFGQSDIWRDALTVPLTLTAAQPDATLTVTWQGCAAAGFCYPPETREVPLSALSAPPASPAVTNPPAPAEAGSAAPLPFSPLWALLIGIGVAFTPCVLPMYPLISSLILGGNRRYGAVRLFTLAMVYVQGMALSYTLMGLIVAAAGLRFQAALQAPAVLIALSVLFVLLALSMFGLFTLQLPAGLQTRLTLWSNRQQGGSLPGVFLMGALAGLICSPCTTAPLSAILLYIAQSGNLAAGAGTLYLYALGMGLPLILVTLFGHKLLPKSGPWMQTVKEGFGFVILALPVFLLERIVGDLWGMRLWSLLAASFFIWAFIRLLPGRRGLVRIVQMVCLLAAIVAAKPLQEWAFGAPAAQPAAASLNFTRISDSDGLREALQQSAGRVTMLDLYADWCVACKAFEKYTFSDPGVQAALGNVQRLQADVTANSAADSALLRQLGVPGLPTLLFFDAHGQEIPHARVAGFMDAEQFQRHLQKVLR